MASDGFFSDDAPYEKAREEAKNFAASVSSTSIAETTADATQINPGRSLWINSRRIRLIRLPLPSSELEICVHHSDGSLAYVSTRERRCSGNAVLSSPKLGELWTTTYFFG